MEAQRLTQDGLKWLKVDICNTFGEDKLLIEQQIQWVDERYDILEALADEAESKGEFLKAVNVLRQHDRGEKVKHMMYIDCSNQALQLYGVLTSDYETAYICNLSSGETRTDAYGLLAKQMNAELKTDIFTRSNCKKAFMTTLYGKRGAQVAILSHMNITEQELGVMIYNNENKHILENNENWLGDAFSNAMKTLAPKAMLAMKMIQALNDENINTYYWTMPDGFRVKYDVKRDVEYEGSRVSRNGLSFDFKTSTSIYGGTKYNAGMAPNVIHSVDGYTARQLIRSMGDKYITSIHDAFGVHPNDVSQLKTNYANLMIELLHSNLLEDIIKQIANGRPYTVPPKSNTLTEEQILSSVYAIA